MLNESFGNEFAANTSLESVIRTFADCDTHLAPSYSLIPQTVEDESNHMLSAAGSEDGADADASN